MTGGREQRLRALADLVRGGGIASQEDATVRLAEQGLAVTQATVSRDLDQIGAFKVKRDGATVYALPESSGDGSSLKRILAEWLLSAEAAGNLVVIKTPPGSAHLVAFALDAAALEEVAGTIAGDDTLFVALRDGTNSYTLAGRLRALAGQE